jgi:hypothetical protein
MHGASSHPNPRNVASLRSRNQARFSCLISDSSLLLTAERRFAPTTVRYRRISVRYESEQVSAFIGIRIQTAGRHQRPNRAASRVAGSAMVWMTLSRCMFRSTPGGGFRMRFTAASGWFPDQSPRTTLGSWARSVPAGRNMRHRGPRWDPAATRTNPHGSWLSACRGHPAIASPQAASNPTSHPDLSHGGERNVLENAFGLVEFQERIP